MHPRGCAFPGSLAAQNPWSSPTAFGALVGPAGPGPVSGHWQTWAHSADGHDGTHHVNELLCHRIRRAHRTQVETLIDGGHDDADILFPSAQGLGSTS